MSNENIYYNIRVSVKGNPNKIAEFNETRVEPILNNPSSYELAVERFYIPSLEIPVMLWKDNYWSLTLSYDNVDTTIILDWIPNSSGGGSPYGRSIYNYQEMLDIVNKAFQDAFILLKSAKPSAPPTEAPYITYDAKTKLFSFNAQQTYDSSSLTPTIEIFFNINLFSLFNSFQDFEQEEQNPKAHKILVKDNGNNGNIIPGYFSTAGEWITLYTWSDIQQIVLESNSIPVVPELQQSTTNITQQVITDFEPTQDISNRSAYQFFPQGPLRYYDLNMNNPLYTINLRVSWKDNDGKSYPLYLPDNDVLTVKLIFRKKLYIQ